MVTVPETVMNIWLILALLITVSVAILIPTVAWKGAAPFTRLNYFGFALGSTFLGVLFLFLSTEGEQWSRGLSILLFGIAWGSFMALFFYRGSGTSPRNIGKQWWFVCSGLAAVIVLPPIVLRTPEILREVPVPNSELSKLKIDGANLDDVGYLHGVLYNGSAWTIRSVTIQVTVYKDTDAETQPKQNMAPVDRSKPLRVMGPDGNIYTFPPGTTADQAKQYFEKKGISPLIREYAIGVFCKSQSSEDVIENVGVVLKEHQRWKYQIIRATGFKD